jgi:acetylornithine/N-succinyldiaminopimelate aminotransferase
VLDVVLADGFLERVRRTRSAQAEARRDQGPLSRGDRRGARRGLLVGLRAVVPSAELVDELRAEKMITVAAGDNVVRLLPPLIVSEDESPRRCGASSAPARASRRRADAQRRERPDERNGIRHFLDLIDIPRRSCAG